MPRPAFSQSPTPAAYVLITGLMMFSIAFLVLGPGRRSGPNNRRGLPGLPVASEERAATTSSQKLEGDAARRYMQETSDGQSLMQAVSEARFGLKWQDEGPFGERGGGYLGMSHVQNLNAWFSDDGVTVHPTVAAEERERAWQMQLRLKAYGYGNQLTAAPPIVSHQVKGTRIEYERRDCQLQIANCRLAMTSSPNPFSNVKPSPSEVEGFGIFQSAIGNRQSAMTEWYENRAEGIEQGFTVSERPERKAGSDKEPLRLIVALNGDLHARATDEGRAVELSDAAGKPTLSYGQLTAVDAKQMRLPAHMEASADGREIALVVDDRSASYPIVIDPVVATLQTILDANPSPHAKAQFGDAVAIDGDWAVVGAWLDDQWNTDAGVTYSFKRQGTTWAWSGAVGSIKANSQCGYSVAISGDKAAYGCPGANLNAGQAWIDDLSAGSVNEIKPSIAPVAGDKYGASVAINSQYVVVGAPNWQNSGGYFLFGLGLDGSTSQSEFVALSPKSAQLLGTSVAIGENGTVVAGEPGIESVLVKGPGGIKTLQPNDGKAGDLFGEQVAISGNTIVVGAGGNDEKGTDAGAAYVFVRDSEGQWSQQQKLTASDAQASDLFGYHAVAIEGNTIVVGALFSDAGFADPNDNRGAAYVFMRNGTTWTEQRRIRVSPSFDGSMPGNMFGDSVAISGGTVIVGAQHAPAADGTLDTGAAYVYTLDCVPPYATYIGFVGGAGDQLTVCPGGLLPLNIFGHNPLNNLETFQWRRNGVNIPGATENVLNLFSLSTNDTGVYDAVVSTSCGSDISAPYTLNVLSFTINPTSQNFGAAGSNGIVNVTSGGPCGWNAVSNASFITITSGATGNAPGTVGFTVAPNTGPNQRSGTITIADKTFTVTQDGLNCSYSIAPTSQSFSAAAGGSSVAVTATAGCAWTAQSNDSWITVPQGGGTGNGTLNYSVAANIGPARSGTLTVAGQTVTVTQANGCTYAINPTSQNFPATFAAGAVNVTTANGCTWTAASNSPFLIVTSGASGSGNGSVGYSVNANDTTSQRNGTITIAGQTFTVTQDGATPTPTPTPTPNAVQFSSSNYSVQEDCTTLTITVNRIGDASGAASVDYSTADVTATERKDYIKALGTLRFATGETSKSFAVLINEDSFVEGNETFNVNLTNPVGVTLGAPAVTTVTIIDDATEPAANPIDDPQNFVCQQYHDFLNRQPDAAGLAFWANEINSCGSNQACIDVKRANVSAAFYLSIEFQQTGYFIERLYKAAYGNATGNSTFPSSHQLAVPVVRLNEFLSDTQRIGQGIIVGQSGWEQLLESNKQSFTADFVLRARFITAFPVSMTAARFVDTLNANAGNPLSPSERDQLVSDLATNVKTRAQALRQVAEHPNLQNAEFNRAFVLMQFGGYLRRNPNDPQDTDYTGYDFWLTKLNGFNGDYIGAEMVRAFITSAEYRNRFGS